MRALGLCLLLAAPAAASNEDAAFGARAAGLADAVTADTEGLGSLSDNPAALGQLRRAQVEMVSRRLFMLPAGPTNDSGMGLAAAVPLDGPWARGGLGLSWTYDGMDDVSLDRTLALTYGSRSWRELGPGTLDAGLTFKTLGRSGRAPGGATAKAGIDLGLLYRWGETSAGLALLNVNGPDTQLGPLPDRAPVIAKLGVARSVHRFNVMADLTERESTPSRRASPSLAAGFEYSWATVMSGLLAGRSGLSLGSLGKSWSLGLGWRAQGASLDYAVRIPLSNGSRWSHTVSLSYRFGAWDPEAEYERLLKTEMGYRRDLSEALEAAEVKQWRLAEELRVLRAQMEDLRRDLELKAAEAGESQERARRAEQAVRLKELEEKQRRLEAEQRRQQAEAKRMKEADFEGRFQEEWRRYQELKLSGVPASTLADRLRNILSEFKGKGVDLSEANAEFQRLERR